MEVVMKRVLAAIAFLCAITMAIAAHARAEEVKMVFWYPGEAGSTAEAQPVMDAFSEYVSSGMKPDQLKAQYFNTVKGGLDYISRHKPKVGIISYAAWTQNRTKLQGAGVVLATRPLPKGKEVQTYALVGKGKSVPDGAKVYSSEPLSTGFVKAHLFAELPSGVTLVQTDRMFVKLKGIAAGQDNAFALLTDTEASTLKRLKSDWAKSLDTIERSKPVPTARVVVFDASWKGKEKFSEVLLTANKDPKAAEVLEEMRLVGFGRVN
jgi:hypothetical protein